jgi:predicted ester cyclase
MPTHSGSLDPTSSPTEVTERFGKEVLNDKNLSAIDEIAAEDYVKPDGLPGQAPGQDGLKALLETKLLPAFPDGQWINEEEVAEGEKVVTRFTFYGTHQGTFMGIPPTGRRVAVGGVVIDPVGAKTGVPSPTFPTTSTVLELITRLVAALSPTH